MDAAREAWLDQEDAHIGEIVRRYGWFIQYVAGDSVCPAPGCDCSGQDSVPFAYTVGLFGMNHPELLILGVPQQTAGGVLNDLGAQIRAGRNLLPGELITFEAWPHRIIAEEVPAPRPDRVLGQPVLPAATRALRAGAATELRRQGRPLPVGAGLRGARDAAAAGHVQRMMAAVKAASTASAKAPMEPNSRL
jgi:hypothetical protein